MTSGSTSPLTRDPGATAAPATSPAPVPPGASRVAAIDCGTNSIRLLVADVDPQAGTLVDLDRRMEVVRLGQGVDRTGRLAPEALARTLDAAMRYASVCDGLGVEAIRFVATSATRDAENRQEFVDGVLAGVHPGPFLVVDLGGGSTEVVLGTDAPTAAFSMDVGCVRLTERHLRSDPPSADEIAAAVADVRAALDEAAAVVPFGRAVTLVGLAGSVTTVTAHALGLPAYDPKAIDGAVLSVEATLAACDDLLGRTREERASLGFMHPGRVDVIGAGALVWREVVARVRDDVAAAGGRLENVVTSEHDILDGIAWSAAVR